MNTTITPNPLTTWPAIRQYVLAGEAVFTVANPSTGYWVTYKVTRKPGALDAWFVGYLAGPDNEADYTYLGLLADHPRFSPRFRVWHTRATKVVKDTAVWRGAEWLAKHLDEKGNFPPALEFLPSSTCARCGRTLTTPESVLRGFGPECWEAVNGGAA